MPRRSEAAADLRFAVLGSPIAHSLSPQLHGAAFALQRLDWQYGRHEVDEASFGSFITGLDASWRGLSLTMPLKRVALDFLDWVDAAALQLNAVNTIRLDASGRRGWNTDVPGAALALRDAGVGDVHHVVYFGGGATAGSLMATALQFGARQATVVLRDPAKASGLKRLGEELGVGVEAIPLAAVAHSTMLRADNIGLVVNTIPAASGFPEDIPAHLLHAPLFEASYSPWPSPAATRWRSADGTVVPGIDMLIHQAVLQQRIFVNGSPDEALDQEHAVLEAMRQVVGRTLGEDWRGMPEQDQHESHA